MDNRTAFFTQRFTSAQQELGAKAPRDIVSLKYRDDGVSYSEYERFIMENLQDALRLDVRPARGDFSGRAWTVSNPQGTKVILVEHETGLEILYVAGSVASLMTLVPMISSGWTWLRRARSRAHFRRRGSQEIEMRRLNNKNMLIEQHIESVEVYIMDCVCKDRDELREKVRDLESEVLRLKKQKHVPAKSISASTAKKKNAANKRVDPTRSPRRARRE